MFSFHLAVKRPTRAVEELHVKMDRLAVYCAIVAQRCLQSCAKSAVGESSVLNGKWHSLGKACNLTVRRDHGNPLRLAGLRCRSYIDWVIRGVALAKACSA